MAEALGADYWPTGPEEDGYGGELERLLAAATCRAHRRIPAGLTMDDAYAACDAVVFLSTREGFGAPPDRGVTAPPPPGRRRLPGGRRAGQVRLPLVLGRRPHPPVFLDQPDLGLLEANHAIARRHFSMDASPASSAPCPGRGWVPQDSPPMSTW